MSWYIGLGRTSCENETWSSRRSSRPYGTVRVPDMDPPPSSALSLFILVQIDSRGMAHSGQGHGPRAGQWQGQDRAGPGQHQMALMATWAHTSLATVFGIFSRKVKIILEQGAEMTDAQESSQTSSAKARGKRINGLVRKVLEPAVLRAGHPPASTREELWLLLQRSSGAETLLVSDCGAHAIAEVGLPLAQEIWQSGKLPCLPPWARCPSRRSCPVPGNPSSLHGGTMVTR